MCKVQIKLKYSETLKCAAGVSLNHALFILYFVFHNFATSRRRDMLVLRVVSILTE